MARTAKLNPLEKSFKIQSLKQAICELEVIADDKDYSDLVRAVIQERIDTFSKELNGLEGEE